MAFGKRCEDCRFWDNSSSLRDAENTGQCRILPPRAERHTGRAVWPYTEDTDWCGNFTETTAPPSENPDDLYDNIPFLERVMPPFVKLTQRGDNPPYELHLQTPFTFEGRPGQPARSDTGLWRNPDGGRNPGADLRAARHQ